MSVLSKHKDTSATTTIQSRWMELFLVVTGLITDIGKFSRNNDPVTLGHLQGHLLNCWQRVLSHRFWLFKCHFSVFGGPQTNPLTKRSFDVTRSDIHLTVLLSSMDGVFSFSNLRSVDCLTNQCHLINPLLQIHSHRLAFYVIGFWSCQLLTLCCFPMHFLKSNFIFSSYFSFDHVFYFYVSVVFYSLLILLFHSCC